MFLADLLHIFSYTVVDDRESNTGKFHEDSDLQTTDELE